MLSRLGLWALALAALTPCVGRAKPAMSPLGRVERALRGHPAAGWTLEVPIDLDVSSGYLHGLGVRTGTGAFAGLGVRVRPKLTHRKRLRLGADLRYRHRETGELALDQRHLSADVDAAARVFDHGWLSATGGVRWLSRPGWPDLYQPRVDASGTPTGGWAPTDRFGRTSLSAGLGFEQRLIRRWTLKATAGVLDRVYAPETAYDPVLRPVHLTPKDHRIWSASAKLSGRTRDRVWRGTLSAGFKRADYAYIFARDAGSGATHSGPGGRPPNPLYRVWSARLRHRSSLWLKRLKTRLGLVAGFTHTVDEFAGYYSAEGVDVALKVRTRPAAGWVIEARAGARWRWYGDGSYVEGTRHPPLDDDARRWARRWSAGAEVSRGFLNRRLTPYLAGALVARETNFPDYAPFVFPAAQPYTIDWDADTWRVQAGLRLALDP